jgi:predicted nucleic-acid-binding Zn-ribbon protein
MTEPTCPKCAAHEFAYKPVSGGFRALFHSVYVVYCKMCGHIVGCVGG